MNYNEAILIFIILMIGIFIFDYFLINKRKLASLNSKNKKKKKSIGEMDYLIIKYELNPKKLNKNRVIIWISVINSFIIAIVSSIIMLMPFKLVWQLLIAFVLLFALIYSLYEIYGRHLKKLEERKKSTKSKKDIKE